MKKIRCYVIDDEPLASSLLADYINKTPELELIGVENSATIALHNLKELNLDLCFIDIQMPEITGLELMSLVDTPCRFIITSAYQEYALSSYEHNVIDYLLKPISYMRFLKAINKVKQFIPTAFHMPSLANFIFVKVDRTHTKVMLHDVLYIEALKDYLCFHLLHEQLIVLATMKTFEEQLVPHGFIRIHKSYIINPIHIQGIENTIIYLKKKCLPIGNTYKKEVLQRLAISNK